MKTLGGSGIEVFPLNLGGNTFGWTSDRKTSHQVLDAYVEAGGNFIDSADAYSFWVPGNSGGESETVIGTWLAARGNRERIVVATKVSDHPQFRGLSAATVVAAVDASLARLGIDHVDLYYAHNDDADTPLEETAAAFDALVRAGKIRAIGVSNYSGVRIREWFDVARRNGLALPVAVQPHYNLVKRATYERDIAPVAAAEQLAVVPYFGLASGFLTGKYRTIADLTGGPRDAFVKDYLTEDGLAVVEVVKGIADARGIAPASVALSWLRGRPNIIAPVASARTVDQLPALLAATALDLTPDERTSLDEVSGRVPQ
ncbi:aldo/keto reductase [Kibdelosporangium aridum]|uniref:aldo/keto reductase n=1 Tax=Kibdelosporangium aridum TaxID=2030 RepID=UPI0035E4D64B